MQSIEPTHYLPIIPLVLVNGADGIGTGWSTSVPNHNPRDVIAVGEWGLSVNCIILEVTTVQYIAGLAAS